MRKWNFCAGPAVISEEVLKEVQNELVEWGDSGMSIMEMSHRSSIYDQVAIEAKSDLVDILSIPDTHDVLFLQGGATQQFATIPMNFASDSKKADYVLSGTWSKKAIAEASKLINVNTIASSEDNGSYTKAPHPDSWNISPDSSYVHYCPNETIQGVSIHKAPSINKPLIADMSSVILSEPLDVSDFSMIYANKLRFVFLVVPFFVAIKMNLSSENSSTGRISLTDSSSSRLSILTKGLPLEILDATGISYTFNQKTFPLVVKHKI